MFSCKGCKAHEKHIDSLEREIARLHELLRPINIPSHQNREINAVLNGEQEQLDDWSKPMTPEERERQLQILSEREAILSGTYADNP